MTRGVGGKSPANIQKHLQGVSYPASKNELISRARENDAPREVIQELERLDQERFGGPQEVMQAYGKIE